MPATDEYVRSPKQMHRIFALSTVLMFIAFLWMMVADHADEWRDYQTVFNDNFNGAPVYAPLDTVYQATKKYNRGTRLLVRTAYHDAPHITAMSEDFQNLFESRQMDVDLQSSCNTFKDRQFADSQYAININMLLMIPRN